MPDPNRVAQELFDPLPDRYDRLAEVLSFRQNGRWRRAMCDHVVGTRPERLLDVASGTAGVAIQLARRSPARVVGIDLTEQMLRRGRANVERERLVDRVSLTAGRAEQLPFRDATFDGLTFTYLLRYVDDPAATVAELVRVLRPGGVMASLEFHAPQDPWLHAGWTAYTRGLMPLIGGAVSSEWYRTGRFLGPSISGFVERYPLPVQVRMWQDAGMRNIRTRRMTMGSAVVTWGVKRNPVTG